MTEIQQLRDFLKMVLQSKATDLQKIDAIIDGVFLGMTYRDRSKMHKKWVELKKQWDDV